jgi:hypothetical protein
MKKCGLLLSTTDSIKKIPLPSKERASSIHPWNFYYKAHPWTSSGVAQCGTLFEGEAMREVR